MAKLTIIVACGTNRAIGKDNKLLWSLPEDMKLFKTNTLGRTVVMGRRTAESIGRALPKRRNLVLTSGDAPFEGVEVVRSLQEAIDAVGADEELCVIGGERLYAEALPLCNRIKLTLVLDQPEADAFFPAVDLITGWRLLERREFPETLIGTTNGQDFSPAFTYMEYVRCN
jgi:dihydrofolate reductase